VARGTGHGGGKLERGDERFAPNKGKVTRPVGEKQPGKEKEKFAQKKSEKSIELEERYQERGGWCCRKGGDGLLVIGYSKHRDNKIQKVSSKARSLRRKKKKNRIVRKKRA